MKVEAFPPAERCCHSLTEKGEYRKFPLFPVQLVTEFLTAARVWSSQSCNHAAHQLWIHWCHVKR
jgi:hypothetical protein